jgi:hypothetical protein
MQEMRKADGTKDLFVIIPEQVAFHENLDIYDIRIYLRIASYQTICCESYDTLMRICRIGSRARISKSIKKLLALGFITRTFARRVPKYRTKWHTDRTSGIVRQANRRDTSIVSLSNYGSSLGSTSTVRQGVPTYHKGLTTNYLPENEDDNKLSTEEGKRICKEMANGIFREIPKSSG